MNTSPTYDEDLKQLLDNLRARLDGEVKSLTGEQRKTALKRVSEEIDEAEEVVAQMEVELPSMPISIRQTYQQRLKTSKQGLDKVKKSLKELRFQNQRSELLSGSGYPHPDDPYTDDPESMSARTRLLAGTQTLEDGTNRLDNAHRIALETEGVGSEILRNLRGQREQLENTRDTLVQADSSIDRAAGTLKRMIFKAYQQKFVSAGIIIVLVLLILLVLYSKFFR
ncbi:hypothetical protein L204_104915 [Cryptococcus depauperatus]